MLWCEINVVLEICQYVETNYCIRLLHYHQSYFKIDSRIPIQILKLSIIKFIIIIIIL
jgi:hypothetical protein